MNVILDLDLQVPVHEVGERQVVGKGKVTEGDRAGRADPAGRVIGPIRTATLAVTGLFGLISKRSLKCIRILFLRISRRPDRGRSGTDV